jgi:hypothetical protein
MSETLNISPEQLSSVLNDGAMPTVTATEQSNSEPIQQGEQQETKQQSATETQQQEPIKTDFDVNTFVKENFGFDSLEVAKQEFEKLKAPKEVDEIKFANEESKKLFDYLKEGKKDEALKILYEQEKINKVLSAEINKDNAAEIIKLGLQQKYKDLTQDEIDYKFEKQYSIPKKPEQSLDETDDDYQLKLDNWSKQVQALEKEMIIDAKLTKPELEKIKTELVLPDIQKPTNQNNQQNQEELAKIEQIRKVYEETLESDYKNFNGISLTYKDEDVEIPITFSIKDDEKVALKEEMKNFDSNEYLGKRWFSEDGKPKTTLILEDKYLLDNKEKIFQKIASEAVAAVKIEYEKRLGNIDLKVANQSSNDIAKVSELDVVAKQMMELL